MKLEEILNTLDVKAYNCDECGLVFDHDDMKELYNYQQDIINKLLSNSHSQFETNQVLVNRLLELKSWLEIEILLHQDDLSRSSRGELAYAYIEGIIVGLKLVNEKIN